MNIEVLFIVWVFESRNRNVNTLNNTQRGRLCIAPIYIRTIQLKYSIPCTWFPNKTFLIKDAHQTYLFVYIHIEVKCSTSIFNYFIFDWQASKQLRTKWEQRKKKRRRLEIARRWERRRRRRRWRKNRAEKKNKTTNDHLRCWFFSSLMDQHEMDCEIEKRHRLECFNGYSMRKNLFNIILRI